MNKKAVFFWGSSTNIGLTTHFSTQIIDMYQYGINKDWHIYLLSTPEEQNLGLWRRVEKEIPLNYIIKYEESKIDRLNDDLLREFVQYDKVVIHVQGISQLLSIKSLLRDKKVKVVTTIHAFANGIPYKRPIVSSIYTYLINKYVDKAIFLSPFAIRSFWGANFLLKRGKIVHIPFNLKYSQEKKDSENRYFDLDKFNIIYLANFTRNKGHERFLYAIIKFCQENANVRFYFFGEGERRKDILAKVKKAKCEEQIFCPGRISYSDVENVLQYADVALNLSASETAGHAAIEPIMYSIPLVATRVGLAEYILQDYITGYGVSSPNELFEKLQYVYTHYDHSRKVAMEAKKIATTIFDYEKMIEAYFELYENL